MATFKSVSEAGAAPGVPARLTMNSTVPQGGACATGWSVGPLRDTPMVRCYPAETPDG